ncbi:hypothetical protein SISNIDRAFT_420517, partial [Sistotremastrum niveocremeum HHB9708]
FICTADIKFGTMTKLRQKGVIVKEIPWTAFTLTEADWQRVRELIFILQDADQVQQIFSYKYLPCLWRALPAFERLQTAWERKHRDSRFLIYREAIGDGLDKLNKYYCHFDKKPLFVLALVLHPYFKLEYIDEKWGGAEEQAKEIAKGYPDAVNWQAEARRVLHEHVSDSFQSTI